MVWNLLRKTESMPCGWGSGCGYLKKLFAVGRYQNYKWAQYFSNAIKMTCKCLSTVGDCMCILVSVALGKSAVFPEPFPFHCHDDVDSSDFIWKDFSSLHRSGSWVSCIAWSAGQLYSMKCWSAKPRPRETKWNYVQVYTLVLELACL